MPIKATQLLRPTKCLPVKVKYFDGTREQDETLTIIHRVITPEMWAEVLAKRPEADNSPEDEAARREAMTRLVAIASLPSSELLPDVLAEIKTLVEGLSKPEPSPSATEILKRNSLIKEVLDFLVSWDVLGEDGQPLPITHDNLAQIDIKILKEISNAVYRYTFPDWTT